VMVRHRMLIFVAKILWSTTHAPQNAYIGAPQMRFSLLVSMPRSRHQGPRPAGLHRHSPPCAQLQPPSRSHYPTTFPSGAPACLLFPTAFLHQPPPPLASADHREANLHPPSSTVRPPRPATPISRLAAAHTTRQTKRQSSTTADVSQWI
jgi:hypothetical protein